MVLKIHTLVWFEGVSVPEGNTAPYSATTIDSVCSSESDNQLLGYTVSCLKTPQCHVLS